jgi:hypothetical protein
LKPLYDVFGDQFSDWLSRVGFVVKVVQGDGQELLPLGGAVGMGTLICGSSSHTLCGSGASMVFSGVVSVHYYVPGPIPLSI